MPRSARRSSISIEASSALPCQTDPMTQSVRVGLVGTSWWAEAMYLPALADHPIGQITAMCGRDRDRARSVADQWAIPHAYNDWSTMLDSGDIDAVIVASPNETHFEISMAAL